MIYFNLQNQIIYLLRAIGQIMFQSSAKTGVVFLISIYIYSDFMAFAVVVAVSLSLLCAYFLKIKSYYITQGLFGFNCAFQIQLANHCKVHRQKVWW